MKIELLYFEGCPNYKPVLGQLDELLALRGIREEIELRRVESQQAAEGERFLGSPTVRIDGTDVDPGAGERTDFGIKCRLYATEDGYVPMPPREWMEAALERPRGPGGDRSHG